MRASNLPSLRGRISSSHALRIEAAKALSAAEVAARRASVGFGSAGADLAAFFETARLQAVRQSQAASIDVLPATTTKAIGGTQQLAVTATYTAIPASTPVPTQVVTGDGRCVYTSSVPARAVVSTTGLITIPPGATAGAATITATFNGRTDTCVVTVA